MSENKIAAFETVAADRLQRHLGGELGRVAEIEEAPGLFPHRTILGEIAAAPLGLQLEGP